MTQEIKKGVFVHDQMMKEIHIGQILREIQARVPAAHFRYEVEDSVFTRITLKIPTKIWHESTKVEKKHLNTSKV